MNVALWIIQVLLALLFLFGGGVKLVLPLNEAATQLGLPVSFLRFIGVCEVLGGLGLVLPWLLRIRPGLTSLAAAGLIVIMIGATVLSYKHGPMVTALFPLVTGLLLVFVVYGRLSQTPNAGRVAP
jgi:peptidoglycan/LPS O-acetylase OafA/YrhL